MAVCLTIETFCGQAYSHARAFHTATKLTHFSLSYTFVTAENQSPSMLYSTNVFWCDQKHTIGVMIKIMCHSMHGLFIFTKATLCEVNVSSLTCFCACIEIGW